MGNQNKKQLCIDDIRSRILTLDIAPGSDLDETSLTQRYGISRTPLREILQQLSGSGYITLEKNRGAKVSSMDIQTMRIFFQTAPLIYSSIARLAAENRTQAQLDELKDAQVDFKRNITANNTTCVALANHRFHEIIAEMAHNPYLLPSMNRMLIDHTRLSQTFYTPASNTEAKLVSKAVQQHDAMIGAIEAGDARAVSELTLQHWDLSKNRLERFVRPDPLPIDMITDQEHRNAI